MGHLKQDPTQQIVRYPYFNIECWYEFKIILNLSIENEK